mgnify:CR=1 FL=1
MITKGIKKAFGELSDKIARVIMAKFRFASQAHVVPDRYEVEDYLSRQENDVEGPNREH